MWHFPANFDHQQMAMIANTLPNDQAIADVVAYIGTLDAPAPPRTETGGDLARGAEYYTCGLCHGSKGQGFKDPRPSTAPLVRNNVITKQQYLVAVFPWHMAGDSANDEGGDEQ